MNVAARGICREDIDALKAWQVKWQVTADKHLSGAGRKEVHDIGEYDYDDLLGHQTSLHITL